jgi:hypothetical protein
MPVFTEAAGVPVGVKPRARSRAWISGVFTIFTISVLSLLTISSGVPAGAKKVCHELPITPLGSSSGLNSVMVGTSGNAGIRSLPDTAKALILLPRIEGMAVVEASR